MRLLYRFLCNFLCTCMLVSSAVLVCCMDMQDRVWLSVSDNLRPRAVPWMCGASRDAHARTRAAAHRPRRYRAFARCWGSLTPNRLRRGWSGYAGRRTPSPPRPVFTPVSARGQTATVPHSAQCFLGLTPSCSDLAGC